MKRLIMVSLLIVSVALAGCVETVGKCADKKTVDLVKSLSLNAITGTTDDLGIYSQLEVSVDNIQTVAITEKPERYACSADVKIKPMVGSRMDTLWKNAVEEEKNFTTLSENDKNKWVKIAKATNIFDFDRLPRILESNLETRAVTVMYTSMLSNIGGEDKNVVMMMPVYGWPDNDIKFLARFSSEYHN